MKNSIPNLLLIFVLLASVLNGCKEEEDTCSDGILNGLETGIDCGGPDCPLCIQNSNSCSNGIQDGDETGIDCGGSCDPCDPTGACIANFTGSGTAVGLTPNNCGDRQVTVTNNGVDTLIMDLPVPGVGTLILKGVITSGCNFIIIPDTISSSGMDTYYSGSGSLSGNTLNFSYRADFSFGSGFDCDYSAVLQ